MWEIKKIWNNPKGNDMDGRIISQMYVLVRGR